MRVRGGHVPPSFARLEHSTQGLVPSQQGLSKEQSFSPYQWMYCSRKCWAESRAARCTSDPGCSQYPYCPRSNVQRCLWHPRASPCLAPQHRSQGGQQPARHCPSPHPLHLCPKSIHPPAAIRWCVRELPAAQPHGLCAGCPAGHQAIRNMPNPSTHPARADPGPKSLPRSARVGDTDSGVGPPDLTMQVLASLILCLGLWAGVSTATIPGGDKDGDGCLAGCSRCPGKMGHPAGHQPGWPQGGFREGSRGCLALQGLMGVTPAFLGTLSQFSPVGSDSCLLLGWGGWGRCL